LYCDGASVPVKIRNISTAGALVEGAVMPSEGSLVQLVRGSLIVHGLVAWSADGRCGIKFSGSVDVNKWRAVPANPEQQRVDEVVRLVKAGAVPLPVPALAHQGQLPSTDLGADLAQVSELLESMGAVLSNDADVVARHGTALQNLDIAMQILAAVKGVIAGDVDLEIEPMKIASLRRSANQALNHPA
jgi:hypothetical protein